MKGLPKALNAKTVCQDQRGKPQVIKHQEPK